MQKYIVLPNPGHNRIYFDAAMKIGQLELRAMFKEQLIHCRETKMGTVSVLEICFDKSLTEAELEKIGRLSLFYVLFEVHEDDLMKIVSVPDFREFPDSLNQILRYNGKTNEQFTRLMVNAAVSACRTNTGKKRLLDPMCGKATTLFEGMIQGYDVTGVEINKKVTKEVETFILRYLKEGRYKHNTRTEKIRGKGSAKLGDAFELNTASDKEAYAKKEIQNFRLITADTAQTEALVKKNSIDMLVSDLPYGVQHGSKTNSNMQTGRRPVELLAQCSKGWYAVMRTGGSVVLAYNEFTIKKQEITDVLEAAGFQVLKDDIYSGYLHRVDQAIKRNIIVAVKAK